MAKPFTRDNTREMAQRSALACKRNRELEAQQIEQMEAEVATWPDKPVANRIRQILLKHPEWLNEMIEGQMKAASAGNTRAFVALADHIDEPVGAEHPNAPAFSPNAVATISALLPPGCAIAIGNGSQGGPAGSIESSTLQPASAGSTATSEC